MSESIPTLEVPAEYYDEALAFCNARLREDGKPEIQTLPAGVAGDSESCPCAMACGVRVGLWRWARGTTPLLEWEGYDPPMGFVTYFDLHARCRTPTLPIRKPD